MLSLKDVGGTRGFQGFKWRAMVQDLIFKVFHKNPHKDFLVTPVNLLENGYIVETHAMEKVFDCPALPTPFARNLFRLYTTIAFVTKKVQLANPDQACQLRAFKDGHPFILTHYFYDSPEVAQALNDIYCWISQESFSDAATIV